MNGDSSRHATQRTAWLNMAAKLLGTGLSFLLLLVLARTMTPEAFAGVAVVLAWLALAAALATFSLPLLIVRVVAENRDGANTRLARGVVQFSLFISTALSVLLGSLALIAVASDLVRIPPELKWSVSVAAALLVPTVLLQVVAGILQSLKRNVAAEVIANVVRSLFALTAIAVLVASGRVPISTATALGAYLVATTGCLLICLVYALAVSPRELVHAKPAYAFRAWGRSALGFVAVMLVAALNERIDMLLLGILAPPSEVASYAVATRFAQIVIFATNAVAAVMAPHLVERLADLRAGRRAEAQTLVRDTARTALLICVLALLTYGALGAFFLALFGAHYESAHRPLVTLAIGQAVAALFGPAIVVATLTGETLIAVGGLLAGIACNALLNTLLVPQFGANGAAFATAVGSVTAAVVAYIWTRRRLGIDTSVLGSPAVSQG